MFKQVSKSKQNLMCRNNYLDVAKGIALFLVVLGHLVRARGTVFTWIFSFHMMLFFFISGYVFDSDKYVRYDFWKYFEKKVNNILIPFAIICTIGWISCFVVPAFRGEGNHITDLLLYYAQPENLHVGQSWFLICLFWTEISFFILYKNVFCKVNFSTVFFITILISIIGFNMNKVTLLNYNRIPWKLDSAITALVFYIAGYYVKKIDIFNILFRYKILSAVLMVIFGAYGFYVSVYKNGYVNICDCQYGDYFYFYLAAFCGIAFILILSKFCENITVLQYYGRNTLWMFSIHSFLLYFSVYVLNLLTHKQYAMMQNIPVIYCFIMAMLIYLVLGFVPSVVNLCVILKNKCILVFNKSINAYRG